MRICLVFPRLKQQLHGLWPPLGIIQLGTVLEREGYKVKLLDSTFDPSLDRIKHELREFNPLIVGVSTLTDIYENAREIISFAKARGCRTIMGGPHATLQPKGTLEELQDLDFVVIGEGEITLLELVSAIQGNQDISNVRNIAFREGTKILLTRSRQPIKNLDSLPVPNRDLLETFPIYLKGKAVSVFAIRGCPYRCSFCHPTLKRLFGAKVRFRSPQNVVDELHMLHLKYKIRDIFFVDDLFTINKKWLRELVNDLERSELVSRLRFSINSRVDLFDEEIVSLLTRMNCYYVLFGVESGSQKILDSCNKGITLEQSMKAFELCKKHKIRTHAYTILGLPGETQETLHETEAFIKDLPTTTLQISIATPLVGTDLFQQCQEKGFLNLTSYKDADYYSKEMADNPIILEDLNFAQLLEMREKILKSRRMGVMVNNFIETCKDLIAERSLSKFLFRARFYVRMKHYWG